MEDIELQSKGEKDLSISTKRTSPSRGWPKNVHIIVTAALLFIFVTSIVLVFTIPRSSAQPAPVDRSPFSTADDVDDSKSPAQKQTTNYKKKRASVDRIDCYPEENFLPSPLTQEMCANRGCIWDPDDGGPSCYVDPLEPFGVTLEYGGIIEESSKGVTVSLTQTVTNSVPFVRNVLSEVYLQIQYMSEDSFRFKFFDPSTPRFEVPKYIVDIEEPDFEIDEPEIDLRYAIEVTENPFSLKIIRRSTGTVVWDNGVGGFMMSNQFLTVSTALPSRYIYGFGENNHKTFRHDLNHRTWGLFSRDQWVDFDIPMNHYSVHPFYMCLEDDGNAHGVLLLNANAQDYTLAPTPMLTYRTIGGVLDFYIFMGPSPENVVQQYTGAVGRPYMPPYWSLGFQLCRFGYRSLDALKAAVDRTLNNDIPLDVQYADIDHMDERKTFTIDQVNFNGLPEYFEQLRANGMHTVIILDPFLVINATNYVPYERMMEDVSVIKWPSVEDMPPEDFAETGTTAMLGFVWPKGKVIFPDFFLERTRQIWKELIIEHRNYIPFDALWIDMNEPANFGTNEERPWNWPEDALPYWSLKCPVNEWDDPEYTTAASFMYGQEWEARLSNKTLCMFARQGADESLLQYDVHSLYGASQIEPTFEALRETLNGKRGMVLSRSTFPGSGRISTRWLGDNQAEWPHLHHSIVGMLEHNLFGFPYVGADICGFFGNTTEEMCGRWMQLGAFYTYSRNHNDDNSRLDHDPGNMGPLVIELSKGALETRYRHLPYLYTLFNQAHTRGSTVVRALFHEYPMDFVARDIDEQFLWGPAMLISPVLTEGQVELNYYLPQGRWYDYYTGSISWSSDGAWHNRMIEPNSPITIHMRGGFIIPTQDPANNTVFSRRNDFHLNVYLDDNDSWGGRAQGSLFWDDGDSIDTYENRNYFESVYACENQRLTVTVTNGGGPDMGVLQLSSVTIYGVAEAPFGVIINGDSNHEDFVHDENLEKLTISNLNLPMSDEFTLDWGSISLPPSQEYDRVECMPEGGDENDCQNKNCIWDETDYGGRVPKCYIDNDIYGYTLESATDSGQTQELTLTRAGATSSIGFGDDLGNIAITIEARDDDLLRIKIYDPSNNRYEVPVDLNLPEMGGSVDPVYEVGWSDVGERPFGLSVSRSEPQTSIWDTSLGGLTFADQFLQLVTRVPSERIYGLGESSHKTFKHDFLYRQWPLFSRDQPPGGGGNLYGVHPYYMCIEDDDGHSHGVLLLNSNAMEIQTLPVPALKYITLGGVLDFYIVFGNSPEEVNIRYHQLIGHPYLPSYWALGFQLCRYGYDHIHNLTAAVDRTIEAGIPLDVQYADIDTFFENRDFTYDPERFAGLPEYFRSLQDKGIHIIIILDPFLATGDEDYLPYIRGRDQDVYIHWPEGFDHPDINRFNSTVMHGYVWPTSEAVFPDYFYPPAISWWENEIELWAEEMPFDGLWIDMNEPANFGTNEDKPWNWPDERPPWSLKCLQHPLDDPPYKIVSLYGERLSDKTICMVGVQKDDVQQYNHYDVHSLYGWSQTESTLRVLQRVRNERGIVISRSTYPTSGKYTGHWLGDNDSRWTHLHESIIGMLEFNLFGIPYVGADICGYFNDVTPEMCQRWQQLGAFYPFSRNHNGMGYIDQDPAIFGPAIAASSKKALVVRYTLLPYLYTLFYDAHTKGSTVVRSLVHEFPGDPQTSSIDRQFLWGPHLLISPVLEQGALSVKAYFPARKEDNPPKRQRWFNYYNGVEEVIDGNGDYIDLDAPLDLIPVHLRGGAILPTQEPANNTVYSRRKPFGLIIAPDEYENAYGTLFWDDGTSIDSIGNNEYIEVEFVFVESGSGPSREQTLDVTRLNTDSNLVTMENMPDMEHIRIFGIDTEPADIVLDIDGSETENISFRYMDSRNELYLYGMTLRLDGDVGRTITIRY